MPVYNAERHLREAIDAVLTQSFKDFVLLISDNASKDTTAAICHEYVNKDERVTYFRQSSNLGAAENFNVLARMAESPFFVWHAADDFWCERYLEACVESLIDSPKAVLSFTKAEPIDEVGDFQETHGVPVDLSGGNPVDRFVRCLEPIPYSENVIYGLIRTSALKKTRLQGPFGGGDRAFLAELSLLGPFVRVNQTLFKRRVHYRHVSDAEVQSYNSGRRVLFALREWRILKWNLITIGRGVEGGVSRTDLLKCVWQRFRREFRVYVREALSAVAAMAGIFSPRH